MDVEKCKKIIIEMLEYLDETDRVFVRQVYTLIKKHLERKRGH